MRKFKTILEPADVDSRLALCIPNGFKCEGTLNIGIFFDGTDNNRRRKEELANPNLNTNITRLWQVYKDRRSIKGLRNANARHRRGTGCERGRIQGGAQA
jgi:hypothetical protein